MTETHPNDPAISGNGQQTFDVKTVAIGLGIGLLAGAWWLFGNPLRSDSETGAISGASSNQTDSLADERQRLEAELENLKLQQEIAALRQKLHGGDPATAAEPSPAAAIPTASATLAFWNRMNDVIERETQLRSAPLGGITSANAGSFLTARIEAAEFAVTSLRALDTSGVDARAVAVSASVASWYEQGRRVADMGRDLLTEGSVKQRQGTAGQQYQTEERRHAAAVGAVNDEGERVRQQLIEEYGIAFPPLK